MSRLRSFLSILIGLIVLGGGFHFSDRVMERLLPAASASGDAPPFNLLILELTYDLVFVFAAVFLAGLIAPRKRRAHACVLGLIWLLWLVAFIIIHWDSSLAWFNLVSILLVMPAAWLGGTLARRLGARGRSHGRSLR